MNVITISEIIHDVLLYCLDKTTISYLEYQKIGLDKYYKFYIFELISVQYVLSILYEHSCVAKKYIPI